MYLAEKNMVQCGCTTYLTDKEDHKLQAVPYSLQASTIGAIVC